MIVSNTVMLAVARLGGFRGGVRRGLSDRRPQA